MPAKDIYHDNCKNALIKDGWTITHDPLKLRWGKKDLYVDLGAQRLIAAEKQEQKIAVEVKSFVSYSEIDDLEKALGQYILYYDILAMREPDRLLYVAIREVTFIDLFEEPIGKLVIDRARIKLVVFEHTNEVITRWVN